MWWILFVLAVAVIAVVTGLMLYGIRRKTPPQDDDDAPGIRMIVIGGFVVPAIVLTVLFVLMVRDLGAESRELDSAEMTIDVIAHQWWWEVRYDDGRIVSANEVHIPTGQQVKMNLTTDDVIHSYWVPQLQAKVDMIPGIVNEIALQADDPGSYRGICGEFCGVQHAKMQFIVIAHAPAEFDAWLEREATVPQTPVDDPGRVAFLGSTCAGCHRVAGTDAQETLGPDLTHFGSRKTIGAGALSNTTPNLTDWVLDSQRAKPGNKMPPSPVTAAELAAIVDYLEGLE
jgi:cytochrome c oxidase subunit 2